MTGAAVKSTGQYYWSILPAADFWSNAILGTSIIYSALHNVDFVSCDVTVISSLASCLTNAQPLPAHHPAADDNSLIGCTSHDLTDGWSQPMPISLRVCVRSFIEPDLFDHSILFDNSTLIYVIILPCKLRLGLGLDLKLHYFSIFHGE